MKGKEGLQIGLPAIEKITDEKVSIPAITRKMTMNT